MNDYEVDCPHCQKVIGIDSDQLPDKACDDEVIECHHCEKDITFGWYAEIELR